MKQRLDTRLVEEGRAESREKAQRLIRSGMVRVDGHPVDKPGTTLHADQVVEVMAEDPYVSRGAQKLEGAARHWHLDFTDRIAVDIGASTGGFTDYMLQHGAQRVHAVDVGKGQLHWKLRQDPRVQVMEGVNARHLPPDSLHPVPNLGVVDVSFISLTRILPALCGNLARPAELVTLIKPQFEAGRDRVGKGGVVRDPQVHQEVIENVRTFGTETCGLEWVDVIPSPIKGPAGNTEFLAYWRLPV